MSCRSVSVICIASAASGVDKQYAAIYQRIAVWFRATLNHPLDSTRNTVQTASELVFCRFLLVYQRCFDGIWTDTKSRQSICQKS